ncbi:MAG: Unknown protein [uncultured Sulfurovum sp.]|uniref:Copper-binding protein MbnP-like domain-containing protein n=1 Tax=uncultured Sulfurovum sp. TaxID=269237 RepID=A0A6S6TCR6_9BACT|nr:MAG: Unknown protein [uncultured Sulfurovum sp.]
MILKKSLAVLSVVGLLMNGCGSSSSTEEAVSEKSISLDFKAIVGDQGALLCSESNGNAKVYNNLGTSLASGTINDFRFFVSEVKLKMSDNTTQTLMLTNNDNQYYSETNGSVAILDFEDGTGDCVNRGNDASTYTSIVGKINSNATVTGVEFTVGVPFALNHVEFSDIPALNKTSMSWSWASGRKFTKFEINPSDANNSTGDIFNFHLGSTGCSDADANGITDACTQPNRIALSFDNFDPATNKVVVDYSKLLTYVDITKNLGGAKGCMSALDDPECMASTGEMFNLVGLDDTSKEGKCLDASCTENQELFSVE